MFYAVHQNPLEEERMTARVQEEERQIMFTIAQMYMHDGEAFILLLESFAREHTYIHKYIPHIHTYPNTHTLCEIKLNSRDILRWY